MDTAIHKSTGKHVSAFQIIKNLEWKGKEREEFIAPFHGVGNWKWLEQKGIKEVKVSFVKQHTRERFGNTETIVSHFRIITEGAIENPENESEEHKLAKEYIYNESIEDNINLKISGNKNKKLSEIGEIIDIRIERGVGKKRADVLIKFKEFDKIYGKGIAFEIQLSPQTITTTEKRNYDRASYGYSIVWIWDKDINEKNEYELIPYNEAIDKYHEQINQRFNENLWDVDERVNEKLIEIESNFSEKYNHYGIRKQVIKTEIESNLNKLEDLKNKTIFEINKSEDNLKQEIKNQQQLLEEKIKKEIQENLKEKLTDKFNNLDLSKYFNEIFTQEYISKKLENYILNNLSIKIDNSLISEIKNWLSKNQNTIDTQWFKIIEKYITEKQKEFENKIKELEKENNAHVSFAVCNIKMKEGRIIDRIKNESVKKILKEQDLIQDVKKGINELIKKEVESKFISFKEENIMSYVKNKTSLYIQCSNCKSEMNVMNLNILQSGNLYEILCDKCKEERDGEKKENKD